MFKDFMFLKKKHYIHFNTFHSFLPLYLIPYTNFRFKLVLVYINVGHNSIDFLVLFSMSLEGLLLQGSFFRKFSLIIPKCDPF